MNRDLATQDQLAAEEEQANQTGGDRLAADLGVPGLARTIDEAFADWQDMKPIPVLKRITARCDMSITKRILGEIDADQWLLNT